jgi:hypothetical protein
VARLEGLLAQKATERIRVVGLYRRGRLEHAKTPMHIEATPVVQGKVVRTRPRCAYPEVAKYKGSGSIDDAANFSCGKQ